MNKYLVASACSVLTLGVLGSAPANAALLDFKFALESGGTQSFTLDTNSLSDAPAFYDKSISVYNFQISNSPQLPNLSFPKFFMGVNVVGGNTIFFENLRPADNTQKIAATNIIWKGNTLYFLKLSENPSDYVLHDAYITLLLPTGNKNIPVTLTSITRQGSPTQVPESNSSWALLLLAASGLVMRILGTKNKNLLNF